MALGDKAADQGRLGSHSSGSGRGANSKQGGQPRPAPLLTLLSNALSNGTVANPLRLLLPLKIICLR